MNSCRHTESLVSLYLEDEASPAERRFVETHTAGCSNCRESLDRVAVLMTRLPVLPRLEAGPEFTSRVLARTHGLRAAGVDEPGVFVFPRRRVNWALPAAAAAAILLALVGVRTVFRAPDSGPAMVQTPGIPSEAGSPAAEVSPADDPRVMVPPPEVVTLGEGEGQSLGMVRDSYALGTYELRTPADGGTPVLTRVAAGREAPVTVTF